MSRKKKAEQQDEDLEPSVEAEVQDAETPAQEQETPAPPVEEEKVEKESTVAPKSVTKPKNKLRVILK